MQARWATKARNGILVVVLWCFVTSIPLHPIRHLDSFLSLPSPPRLSSSPSSPQPPLLPRLLPFSGPLHPLHTSLLLSCVACMALLCLSGARSLVLGVLIAAGTRGFGLYNTTAGLLCASYASYLTSLTLFILTHLVPHHASPPSVSIMFTPASLPPF